MGNPAFAVPALRAIHLSTHQLVAVVTGPDKPAGRGRQLRPTPVREVALELGYPALQPADLSVPDFHGQLRDLKADLIVVLAFKFLPDEVLQIPPLGAINLHPSLLPAYRGAAPVRHALMQGETVTGVTTIALSSRIDAGDICLQREVAIEADDDHGSLSDRLAAIGADLLVETIDGLETGNLKPRPQGEDPGKRRAPKIGPADMHIDWNQPSADIVNRIRAFSPAPGAVTMLNGKRLKIFSAESGTGQGRPGLVLRQNGQLEVAALSGSVRCKLVQLEGKQRMATADFLKGTPVAAETVLG